MPHCSAVSSSALPNTVNSARVTRLLFCSALKKCLLPWRRVPCRAKRKWVIDGGCRGVWNDLGCKCVILGICRGLRKEHTCNMQNDDTEHMPSVCAVTWLSHSFLKVWCKPEEQLFCIALNLHEANYRHMHHFNCNSTALKKPIFQSNHGICHNLHLWTEHDSDMCIRYGKNSEVLLILIIRLSLLVFNIFCWLSGSGDNEELAVWACSHLQTCSKRQNLKIPWYTIWHTYECNRAYSYIADTHQGNKAAKVRTRTKALIHSCWNWFQAATWVFMNTAPNFTTDLAPLYKQ